MPERSNVLVAHPVRIVSATLLGARSCKDWERNTIGSADQLERELLVFQHELRRVPDPSTVLVAHPVRIGRTTLLGVQSCKHWKSDTSGSTDQLEREFML